MNFLNENFTMNFELRTAVGKRKRQNNSDVAGENDPMGDESNSTELASAKRTRFEDGAELSANSSLSMSSVLMDGAFDWNATALNTRNIASAAEEEKLPDDAVIGGASENVLIEDESNVHTQPDDDGEEIMHENENNVELAANQAFDCDEIIGLPIDDLLNDLFGPGATLNDLLDHDAALNEIGDVAEIEIPSIGGGQGIAPSGKGPTPTMPRQHRLNR
jgi:hypothetical protein